MKKSAVTTTTLLYCEQVINIIFHAGLFTATNAGQPNTTVCDMAFNIIFYASLFTATVKWDTFLAAVFL